MKRAAAAILLVLCAAWASGASRAGEVEDENASCLICHGEKDLATSLPDGTSVPLFVDAAAFAGSIHGKDLRCTDCHAGMAEIPHPEMKAKTADEFHAGFREACKSCHFDKYALSLDGIHYQMHAQGNSLTPLCVDCHGSHAIAPASTPRTRVSDTCATCHTDVAETYLESVHGKALAQGNPDVPVCSDCHRSHDISDPRVESWRVKTPELCARCHTDAAMMAKYDLSTNVVQSYLSDFHGVTATMTRARTSDKASDQRVTALCIDCHGVHDVTATDDAASPVLRANLSKTCRKCHEDASENFPDAWLSHYEPSWERAPLVYGVRLFYVVFIPFIIGGLILQVLLHLWRVVVNR